MTRRASSEVRAALLRAAAASFAAKGFRGSTTREIAADAHVSESALYRHFGSKEALFVAATVTPFTEFLDELTARWGRRDAVTIDDDDALMLALVALIYDESAAHRPMTRAVLYGADENPDGLTAGARDALRRMFDELTARTEQWQHRRGVEVPALAVRIRLLVAMTVLTASFGDLFLDGAVPTGRRREVVIQELAGIALRGMLAPRRAR